MHLLSLTHKHNFQNLLNFNQSLKNSEYIYETHLAFEGLHGDSED